MMNHDALANAMVSTTTRLQTIQNPPPNTGIPRDVWTSRRRTRCQRNTPYEMVPR